MARVGWGCSEWQCRLREQVQLVLPCQLLGEDLSLGHRGCTATGTGVGLAGALLGRGQGGSSVGLWLPELSCCRRRSRSSAGRSAASCSSCSRRRSKGRKNCNKSW